MKKILMVLVLAGATSVASAQQVMTATKHKTDLTQNKYEVLTKPFWGNWFFSLGGGAQVLFGNNDQVADFKDRISPTLNVAVGKWFTPGLGLRLQYSGLQAKGYTYDPNGAYVTGGLIDGSYYKQKWDYMNLHGDMMFNLNALFGGYNAKRVYEIIPYLGFGFTHSYSKPHATCATFNAGIINRFRLSNSFDLNLELSAVGLEGKFDGQHSAKRDYDGILGATLGLTYYFPNHGFQRPAPQLISESELRQMRDQINDMAAANSDLQKQLEKAKNRPVQIETKEVVVTDDNIAPRTVFFAIGSATLSPREEMNLSYLANSMKESSTAKYVINGYADSATGTASFNKDLSLKRAQAVKDVLVSKYGISADRLSISAGGGSDKFGQPILNRVVLVESEK